MSPLKRAFATSVLIFVASTASAATRESCEGVSTPDGYKYVGVYCVDYSCEYTVTFMFDSYCPYSVDLD
jgi:hypothetical protein